MPEQLTIEGDHQNVEPVHEHGHSLSIVRVTDTDVMQPVVAALRDMHGVRRRGPR